MVMRKARYVRVDVFSERPFCGNPLAVFPEADGLTKDQMQLLAKEMNLSETTFVVKPSKGSKADFRVRIFVPDNEIPYAGHPTVGTFYVLAKEGRIKLKGPVTRAWMEAIAGVMPVDIYSSKGKVTKVVTHQNKPVFGPVWDDVRTVAEALSLRERDFDPGRMPVRLVSTGLPWLIAPVRTRDAVERAAGNYSAFSEVVSKLPKGVVDIYVTCLEPVKKGSTTHSRGFSLVAKNISEDPATGSASGCLGAYLVEHGLVPRKRSVSVVNEQGYEIGRPSRIDIEVVSGTSGIEQVMVGGSVVHMMDGHAYV
ncbi:MAG: PhzF family phenazine biosynthesis protein [Candidatus Thermoplasmatota archaeon]|nr:PhzF family phenazine biosynthesis protein [Candidatus Thermoplasmatota archaeon]